MAHGVDIGLAHEDAVVGTDQHRAEWVVAVQDRLAGDGGRSAQVSKYLVAGHHLSRHPPNERLHWTEIILKGGQLHHAKTMGELRLDEDDSDHHCAACAEVTGFDSLPLTRSALKLANHVKLRNPSTVRPVIR